MFVITKARGIRPNDGLATLSSKEGATFYLILIMRTDNPENPLNFLHNTYYFLKKNSDFFWSFFPLSVTIFFSSRPKRRDEKKGFPLLSGLKTRYS